MGLSSGRTPQGVRGLKLVDAAQPLVELKSHSARSAWIETIGTRFDLMKYWVALRKECVD